MILLFYLYMTKLDFRMLRFITEINDIQKYLIVDSEYSADLKHKKARYISVL